MNKAWIRAVKEMDERPHPNLQKQVYLNIQALETRKNLNKLSKKQWKKLISEVVQNQGIKTYPDRYPFEKEERISVVTADRDNNTEEVFTGKLKIPEKYREKDAGTEQIY
ncbi:MAG: hypothetical protein ABEJ95_07195 [Candidatus Nanohalobium sp.]